MLAAASQALGATGGGVGLRDPATGLIQLIVDHGYPDTARAAYPAAGTPSFPLADAFARAEPIFVETREALEAAYPVLADLEPNVTAGCWVPLGSAPPVTGVLGLVFESPHRFDGVQRSFLGALAAAGAVALDALGSPAAARRRRRRSGRVAERPGALAPTGHRRAAHAGHPAGPRRVPGLGGGRVAGLHRPGARHGHRPGLAGGGAPRRPGGHPRAGAVAPVRPGPAGTTLRLWHAPSEQWRHVRADFVPVPGEDGTVVEVVGSFTDVDARLTAESQLAGLARLFDSFLTGSPVGFALVDSRLRFQLVNETMAAVNGDAGRPAPGSPAQRGVAGDGPPGRAPAAAGAGHPDADPGPRAQRGWRGPGPHAAGLAGELLPRAAPRRFVAGGGRHPGRHHRPQPGPGPDPRAGGRDRPRTASAPRSTSCATRWPSTRRSATTPVASSTSGSTT